MCHCLSFLVITHRDLDERCVAWRHSLAVLCQRICSWPQMFLSTEVQISITVVSQSGRTNSLGRASALQRQLREKLLSQNGSSEQKMGLRTDAIDHAVKKKDNQDLKSSDLSSKPATASKKRSETKRLGESLMMNGIHIRERSRQTNSNGGNEFASLFTQRGLKGVNQDTMLLWEDFGARSDTIFCGVFDGHGPHGHLVARNVRDMLPLKLASCWQALHMASNHKEKVHDAVGDKIPGSVGINIGDPQLISLWKKSFVNAYKVMDRELLIDENVDCVASGTTAVTLVKQGDHLIIGNVGDSRAILGVRADDNSMLALQLTVDLKPNLPKEAERIRRCKGRVFALREEPSVTRVWLPHHNSPGLAMARALGDFSLKNFGVISVPQITYRRLTEKDKFIVLATDGKAYICDFSGVILNADMGCVEQ